MGLMSVKEYLAHLHEEQNDDQEEPQLLQIDPMGLYDYRSDIWALGVVIHQIFIDGKYIPYRNTEDDLDVEVRLLQLLRVRQRLSNNSF